MLLSTDEVADDAVIGVASTDDEARADEAIEEIALIADETIDEALEAAGVASDDEAGAADEAATDELAVFTVVVVELPRLKNQIRAMMMITATMMITQVLRFMRKTLCWWNQWGRLSCSYRA